MVPAGIVVLGDVIDTNDLGRRVIIPSSFSGGPHYLRQLLQDDMSIIRKFRKPSLCITGTCNLKWTEILKEVSAGKKHRTCQT